MARAHFKDLATEAVFVGSFQGTVFSTVTDPQGRVYRINSSDAEAILVEHLPDLPAAATPAAARKKTLP